MDKSYLPLMSMLCLVACNEENVLTEETNEPDYVFDTVKVLEYSPAPGQFINDSYVPTDAADAAKWAGERINGRRHVSLGAFGGYIVLKPSVSITNREGYDFGISGNPIPTHNEPGIVWVSKDENGNGVADDIWYELRGSESSTCQYEVTYHHPDGLTDIRWEDSNGKSGLVPYIPSYHKQSYYPLWCDVDGSITLSGSLLDPQPGMSTVLSHDPYGWGYADNLGSDAYKDDQERYIFNRFDIDNAVKADGTKAVIDAIDFIKIQSAVLYNLDYLGEISTEVTGFVLLK